MVLLCWDAPGVDPLLLHAHSCLHVALPPGNPSWAQLLEQGQKHRATGLAAPTSVPFGSACCSWAVTSP